MTKSAHEQIDDKLFNQTSVRVFLNADPLQRVFISVCSCQLFKK